MSRHRFTILALLLVAGAASAQVSPGTAPGRPMQTTPGGEVAYISGGAGEEERASMSARQGELPTKVVLSGPGGEYVVADHLTVNAPAGKLLIVRDAGPLVLMNLPPGNYTLEAGWKGRTVRNAVRASGAAQTINLRFP